MQNNYCEEKILTLQKEYPFLLEIGYSLKSAKAYLSMLNQQIDKEKNKNHHLSKEKKRAKQEKKIRSEIHLVDQQLLTELKTQKQALVNYIRYLKRYYQIKQQEEIEKQEELVLTQKQQQLWLEALENNFKNFRLHDFYVIYGYALDKEEYKSVLTNIVSNLQNLYVDANAEEKEEIAIYFSKLRQKTNSYLLHLKSKDKFLKELSKSLQDSRKLHDVSTMPLELEPDALEDFLELLLKQDTSYPYLEKLVYKPIANRDIVNYKDHNGSHILFHIQELLFESCLLELVNQTNDYIDKEFYKKIWRLFYFHPNIQLTEQEQENLNQNLEDFIEFIQQKHYKKGAEMIQFLYGLVKPKESTKISCPTSFDACYYGEYRDLTQEYTFALYEKNPNCLDRAYSVTLTKQGTFLIKVHIVDVSSTVLEDSELDRYLKDKMFKTQDFIPDNILYPYIYLQQDDKQDKPFLTSILDMKKRPVITYEIEVNEQGSIINSDVYQSMVVVNQAFAYQEVDIKTFRKDTNLFPACYVYAAKWGNSLENMEYKLEMAMLSYVKKIIRSYLEKYNLPMIYYLQDRRDEHLYMQYMKDSAYIFGQMRVEEAHICHSILKEDVNYAYLGLKNTGHFSLEDTFCIHAFHPCSNYVDLTVQRLIKMYFISKNRQADPVKIKDMLEELVSLGNERLEEIRKENRVKKLGQFNTK